jgi:hypothetical protein
MADFVAQIADLALVIVVGLVAFSLLGLLAVRRSRQRLSTRSQTDAVEQNFEGRGTETVDLGELLTAQYRVDFEFPANRLVKVELIENNTADRHLILFKSGTGTEGFVVERAGRYFCQVEPQAESDHWVLRLRPVGRFGQL